MCLFPINDFYLAYKRVRCLFRPRHLFPIVHLSRVKWQVPVLVFMSLIAWLEANTFIKVHGFQSLHLLTKCAMSPGIYFIHSVASLHAS